MQNILYLERDHHIYRIVDTVIKFSLIHFISLRLTSYVRQGQDFSPSKMFSLGYKIDKLVLKQVPVFSHTLHYTAIVKQESIC